jgi:hypothetical protein
VAFRPPSRLLGGYDASGAGATAVGSRVGRPRGPWTLDFNSRLRPLLGNNVLVSGAEMEFGLCSGLAGTVGQWVNGGRHVCDWPRTAACGSCDLDALG